MTELPDKRLAIEFISVLGMPPPMFVETAANLGVGRIGLAPAPFTANPHEFAAWDLRSDPALVRATRTALADHGVAVSLGEGFLIMAGMEIADTAPAMDMLHDLGAPCFNVVVVEADRARAADQFARFAEMAHARDAIATVEFLPLQWPATLAEVRDLVVASGAANARLLIDAMHLYRSGATAADLAAIDPGLIGYAQVCDVPLPAHGDNYGEEARHERLCPGEGHLPLAAFCAALPPDITIGLEVPMVARARAGLDTQARLAPCVAAARALLG